MSSNTALALLGVTLALLVLGIGYLDSGRQQRRTVRRRARLTMNQDRIPPWRRALNSFIVSLPFGASVERRLVLAGIQNMLAGDAMLAILALAGVIAFFGSRLVTVPAAAIVGVVVLVAASKYLDSLVQKRADKFAEQLPDIARIMGNAASAGMAIGNALTLVTEEMEEPAHSLLQIAVKQMEVGSSLADAMASLEERAPSREMAVLVSTLIIQQRSGGDVIEALREMSTNLEVRRDLKREVDTTMSGIRFTAYAVMGLGVGVLFLLETITSGTLRRMTESLIGQILLVVSFSLYLIGYTLMRRLSRVDV